MSPEGFNGMSAAKGKVVETDFQLVELPDLQRVYEGVVARETMLNDRLRENNEEALHASDSDRKKENTMRGVEIARELQEINQKKAELEKRIREAGGTPGDHTTQ
ncbi:MAG: hypothetical protein ACYC6X_00770 [Minisyncoccota bacterium]